MKSTFCGIVRRRLRLVSEESGQSLVLALITVLALNVLGDGLRDALDPRSKVRLGRG